LLESDASCDREYVPKNGDITEENYLYAESIINKIFKKVYGFS